MNRPDGRDPESTFSRVMNTPVAQRERENEKQVAVMVIFDPGVTVDAARKELATLKGGGVAEVREFDPNTDNGPVIYFP